MVHIFIKSSKSKVFDLIWTFCRFLVMHIFNSFFKIPKIALGAEDGAGGLRITYNRKLPKCQSTSKITKLCNIFQKEYSEHVEPTKCIFSIYINSLAEAFYAISDLNNQWMLFNSSILPLWYLKSIKLRFKSLMYPHQAYPWWKCQELHSSINATPFGKGGAHWE